MEKFQDAMNSLETYIRSKSLNEIESMNALQDAGVISDLCVFACDVAEADCTAAIAFLTFRGMSEKQQEMPLEK